MGGSVRILQTNMKLAVIGLTTFLASISLAQDVVNEKAGNSIKVDTRAPSTYQNCKCQCDSYTWSDGNYIRGNCRSKAKLPGPSQATGLFLLYLWQRPLFLSRCSTIEFSSGFLWKFALLFLRGLHNSSQKSMH